jgi:hypothetical protein
MSKKSRETEEERKKQAEVRLNKLIEAGPHWKFCPHINGDCNVNCYYIFKPFSWNGYTGKNKWSCTYKRDDDFVASAC